VGLGDSLLPGFVDVRCRRLRLSSPISVLDWMRMSLSRRLRFGLLICLLVCTVGCDQTSKHVARSVLGHASSVSLPGGMVELRLAENPGSFLSLGALLSDPERFAVFTLGVGSGLLALAAYLTSRARIGLMRFIGLSLVVAGGSSNLLDRIFRHGLVTDFATIRIGPLHTGVFNVADVLIMVGIGAVICSLWKRTLPDRPTNQTQR
jgi:signal peptidase II